VLAEADNALVAAHVYRVTCSIPVPVG